MPPNTLRVHTEYGLVKSIGPKVLWHHEVSTDTTSAGGWRIFPFPSSSTPKLWRWRSVLSPSIVKNSNLSQRLWQHSFLPFRNFTELNRTVTCMVLKAKANDRRTSSPCHDKFRGPRSDYVRQVALEITTTVDNLQKFYIR
ncbi:hypothetical protein TNCV_3245721 [Trichonephila clavipes]|nr:hypothetical protein TNCV_3245721 [Trichonephila clavipes]